MTPEFSPSMLSLFLRARCLHQVNSGSARDVDAAGRAIRKAAGVTAAAFDVAWAGRLVKAETRCKLWGALGHVPGDHGVILTDDGGQQTPAGRKGDCPSALVRCPSAGPGRSAAEGDSERTIQ